ncbi:GreA/GreB family elongation factor [Sphingomonas baiyangensis]|uniref:Nucleoside-diphosphate kinase n=1 Tax=Sphingomonas baiyangensis TaxID=2572576 RepID=A0A4U1L2Q1_9SPHN|nr:GreA/GreB family elongation factor [Sphingomonas baiyangensis]TKD51139.1 nucleoside-diphosphate kinase [Sphingomonas baiyangensis]
MSVAFRRESDDEHKEPAFELPLPPGPNLVTAEGLALIEARVAAFEAEVEAAPDDEARKRSKRDLRYWLARASTAEVQPPPPSGEVAFGSRVTYRLDGRERTVALVGSDEADPAAGRIPFTAPLAQAMMGAEAGEHVDFGGRSEAIEIVAAEPMGAP